MNEQTNGEKSSLNLVRFVCEGEISAHLCALLNEMNYFCRVSLTTSKICAHVQRLSWVSCGTVGVMSEVTEGERWRDSGANKNANLANNLKFANKKANKIRQLNKNFTLTPLRAARSGGGEEREATPHPQRHGEWLSDAEQCGAKTKKKIFFKEAAHIYYPIRFIRFLGDMMTAVNT